MTTPPKRLFYVDDPRFDLHMAQGPHPERPERLQAIRAGLLSPLVRAGAERIATRMATTEELVVAHDAEHVSLLERELSRGEPHGHLDEDTFYSAGTHDAAWLAAGAAAELSTRLLAEQNAAGVLLARPPGHHATRSQAMGFCLLNNVAVAAYAALAKGAQRVAILDWDVHHGNGTADIFADDPRVLFISLHQWPLYPGTGRSTEVGRGKGAGATVNLPMPARSGDAEYAAAFARVVEPVLTQFSPELLLVSCGFDAHEDDPLANMSLSSEAYGAMTTSMWNLQQRIGAARMGLLLEGGYSLHALERAGEQVANALLGKSSALAESALPGAAERAIDATRTALDSYYSL